MEIICSLCGSSVVSSDTNGNGATIRAWIECPECIEAQFDFSAIAKSLVLDLEYCLTNNEGWDIEEIRDMKDRLIEAKSKLDLKTI